MTHTIHDTPATIATMTFDRMQCAHVIISGEAYAATYTIDRAARTVTVNYYDDNGTEHVANIPADHPAYLDARHTARAYYRETGEKLPPRSVRAPVAMAANDPRAAMAGTLASGRSWTIYCSAEDRRIKLRFTSRPAAKILEAVKAAGWHWSPNQDCWINKLNTRNVAAAQLLTCQLPA